MKKKQASPPRRREEKRRSMKCPYFSSNSRVCRMMVEKGLDGGVSSFDVEHFCGGNPFYCYYFRSSSSK